MPHHSFTNIAPPAQALPAFLKRTNYRNPNDYANGPFQAAFNTKLPAFAYAGSQPENMANFNQWMAVAHPSNVSFLKAVDLQKYVGGASAEEVAFCDVGGGVGVVCAVVRQGLPDLKGRIVLQEQDIVIPHALPTPGVEKMVYDFWTEQPVKGNEYPHDTSLFPFPHFRILFQGPRPQAYILIPIKAPMSTTCATSCTTTRMSAAASSSRT